MADVIIHPGNGLQYFPSPLSPDFAYRFVREAEIWVCLLRYPLDNSLEEGPAIFRSRDNGSSWSLQDNSGAPISNKIGPTTVTYDAHFNVIKPASVDRITFVYAVNPTLPIYDWYTCDFYFASGSYGSPYGHFTVERPGANHNNFSRRPDGSMITVYGRLGLDSRPIGTFFRTYSGSWGGELLLESGNSFPGNLAVDSSGNSHIITGMGNYYQIDSSNALVAGPTPVYTFGSPGNLIVAGNKLYLAYASGGLTYLATGSPLSNPSWTSEATGGTGVSGTNQPWVQQISGSYALDVEFTGGGSDYTIDAQPFSASGLTYTWIASDHRHIMQSVRSGLIWSPPASIWSSPSALHLFSPAIRGAAGSGPANRYRPIW